MAWIITINGSKCCIYDFQKKSHQLKLINEITNPTSKLKNSDLISDEPGHQTTGGSARGACEWPNNPKEVEFDRFARKLAEELEVGRVTHKYTELIIAASPHINGLLNQHLNKHINQLVIANIKKDLISLTEQELQAYLNDNWQELKNSMHKL